MIKDNNFSYRQFAYLGLIFILVIGALKISPFAIIIVAGLLVFTLVTGNMEHAFGTLMLLFALSVINSVLVEKDFLFYLVTRGSLFLLAGTLTIKSGATKNAWFLSPFYMLITYIIYMMITSLAGWAPLISELKAVLFLVFIMAFIQLVSAVNLKQVNIKFIRSVMLVIASFYILGSIAVIPFPVIGQSMIFKLAERYQQDFEYFNLGSKSLFNGMTWHSQTLGPLIAVINAFVLSDYLCSFKRRNYLYLALLLAAPVLVYKTSSRTALFAYIISVLASLFFYQRERNVRASKKQRILLGFAGMLILVGFLVIINPNTQLKVEAFLRKSGDMASMDTSESLKDSMISSRIGLAEEGMNNFKESPLIGNGFQVSKEMQYIDMRDLGNLVSAPIEKGVLPVMILEEGGGIGALIFFCFVLMIYVKYSKLRLNCFLSTFTVMLALNTGEATFFSTSGSGGILWGICFCSLIIDVDRNRRKLAEQQMQYFNRGPVG